MTFEEMFEEKTRPMTKEDWKLRLQYLQDLARQPAWQLLMVMFETRKQMELAKLASPKSGTEQILRSQGALAMVNDFSVWLQSELNVAEMSLKLEP